MMKQFIYGFGDRLFCKCLYAAAQDLAADYPLIIGALGRTTILTSMGYTLDAMSGYAGLIRQLFLTILAGRGERFVSAYEWASVNFRSKNKDRGF